MHACQGCSSCMQVHPCRSAVAHVGQEAGDLVGEGDARLGPGGQLQRGAARQRQHEAGVAETGAAAGRLRAALNTPGLCCGCRRRRRTCSSPADTAASLVSAVEASASAVACVRSVPRAAMLCSTRNLQRRRAAAARRARIGGSAAATRALPLFGRRVPRGTLSMRVRTSSLQYCTVLLPLTGRRPQWTKSR